MNKSSIPSSPRLPPTSGEDRTFKEQQSVQLKIKKVFEQFEKVVTELKSSNKSTSELFSLDHELFANKIMHKFLNVGTHSPSYLLIVLCYRLLGSVS